MNLSTEELENLSNLFLSKDDSNTKLAFELMEPYKCEKDLITEIFVVYKLTKTRELRIQAEEILKKSGSANIRKAMGRKLEFNTEKTIKTNISKYVATSGNELNGLKFAQALYNKYNLGFAYLMKEGSSDEKREILQKHVDGKTFKLNGKGLTAMPKEFFEFTDLEEINLRGNKIANLNGKYKVFKNLRKLDLRQNCLKKIHKSLSSLVKLEELLLDSNLFEEFPEAIGNFKNLRHLSMTRMLNISGLVRKVAVPDNFFSLKLNYLAVSSDGINGCKHGYEKLPYFSKLEAKEGEFIKLSALDLAKQSFEAGQKYSVYYLLYHADSEYKTKVLQRFYDEKSKTMDLSDMYVKFLPEEIAKFDIKVLNMSKCGFGYNFSLVDSAEEGLKPIGLLTDLEELYLDRNAVRVIPECVFNCTKLRILSMHDNGVERIQPQIKALSKLESLDLDSSSWNPIDFPDEIKELPLKSLKINGLAHKSDEVKETYRKRLKELFGDLVTLY